MKTMNTLKFGTIAVVALAAMAGQAMSQDGSARPITVTPMTQPPVVQPAQTAPAAPAPAPVMEAWKGEWTSPDFEKVANRLIGTWKSTAPISGGPGAPAFDVTMSVAPVRIEGLPNAMYCEVARVDNFRAPFRQTILALSNVRGNIRLQTFEFRTPEGINRSLYNIWAANETFNSITSKDLVATLALDFTQAGDTMTARTPHAYPTATGGAVEMTSELVLTPTGIRTSDRGFGADGAQVWGPAEGTSYEFARWEAPMKVRRMQGGLTFFEYNGPLAGPTAQAGEQITANYTGYLRNGTIFDSSFTRNIPFTYRKGQPLIEGWNIAMEDMQKGTSRRLIIPPELAYGPTGNRNRTVPPNAWLTFDVEILDIAPPPPPPAPPTPAAAQPVSPSAPAAVPAQPTPPASAPK
jgi:peptidylprolyl isomerase/FKBP-type peptidyl-prolyl cis-trans isomerase FkpA